MSRRRARNRRADYGTVLLHWCLVIALAVAILTGLRIAAESPDRTWINTFDSVLPRQLVWTAHMQSAVGLVAVALAYPIYVALARLTRRIRFDRVRFAGLLGCRQARYGAINVALYWVLYLALLCEMSTGALLYFDYGSSLTITLHWLGMWLIVGCTVGHVLVHWQLGAAPQLLRIFRPMRLQAQPPAFDPMDLLELFDQNSLKPERNHGLRPVPLQPGLDTTRASHPFALATEQASYARAGAGEGDFSNQMRTAEPARTRRKTRRNGPVLQSNPFVVALATAIVGTSLLVTAEHQTSQSLEIRRIDAADVPILDGDTSDRVWRLAKPLFIPTGHGDNFDGEGETTVEIRAVHDGERVYFLFAWDDPTRSLKQLPLLKTPDGWKLLHRGYEAGEERAYSEDKFAVLLTKINATLAGDHTFHAGPEPLPGKPRTLSGHGLHYTDQLGVFVDVWEWKATSTNVVGFMDDDHFGPPVEATSEQLEGKFPYRGGFAVDPGTAGYKDNFEQEESNAYNKVVTPRRLPKDIATTTTALGKVDLDPNHGESDGAKWFMTEEESTPYSRELNAKIPVGTVVPGVIVSGTYSGDRADVRCAARWAAGRWALEVTRRLDTGSRYDIPITTGTFMRVAAFDHTQIGHTRHVRPIRLEVE
ncbi:MAG: ethylbenzene dehydrogenase-related protein [Pseudolabrys sp.]